MSEDQRRRDQGRREKRAGYSLHHVEGNSLESLPRSSAADGDPSDGVLEATRLSTIELFWSRACSRTARERWSSAAATVPPAWTSACSSFVRRTLPTRA